MTIEKCFQSQIQDLTFFSLKIIQLFSLVFFFWKMLPFRVISVDIKMAYSVYITFG